MEGGLRDLGVGPERGAAICVERGRDMVAGLLAILEAGGAFLPLDRDYPPDRLRYMLHDAGAGVLVTTRELAARLGERLGVAGGGSAGARTPLLDDPPGAGAGGGRRPRRPPRRRRRGAGARGGGAWGARAARGSGEGGEGGRVQGLGGGLGSGEPLSYDLQRQFHASLAVPLHNLYGPTEAAVDVTHWRCDRDDPRPLVPIGRPVANTRIHVLDRQGEGGPIGGARGAPIRRGPPPPRRPGPPPPPPPPLAPPP